MQHRTDRFCILKLLLCGLPRRQVLFSLLIITGHPAEIRWSFCIRKSKRTWCILLSRTNSGLFTYPLFVCPTFNFRHNSEYIISFLSQHSLSLSRCLELLLEEIQFLSLSFPFLDTSKSPGVRFRLFVFWNIHLVVFLHIISSYYCSVEPCIVSVLFLFFLVAVSSLSLIFFM